MTPSLPRLEVVRGDISAERVDAVVNAANARLAGGGGVDGAIHRAAGASELRAACRAIGGCAPGSAVVTGAFRLPARWIIHTVGPVWRGGTHAEAEILTSCYRSCLAAADVLGAQTVAFPAISTGAYGYPAHAAAAIAVTTVREARTDVQLVRYVVFDEGTLARYLSLLDLATDRPREARSGGRDARSADRSTQLEVAPDERS
jgi:O-acetyl-ADP-ribose deacetylase (regulator of RNase III)